ncbi:radical SAM/SPASM domain-containing protein [Nocardiopsis sp. FIRDI 009]|uniref:radical SAM/SPASM domain-containing protein n=1 Tax=Nocardiopsis sp. FIRDI 009 TaxID=714197 RepID=UPI001E2A7E76|nr:radical SAM protein [Nocardiopsis sp. FIRDI 009]
MTTSLESATPTGPTVPPLRFVWLEITGKCQLACTHCYADSGPDGTHGTMTTDDWRRVIDDVAHTGAGMVQFIGGEPVLHPGLGELIEHALNQRLEVEVFTNLVHVPPGLWEVFKRPGVRLATSWYSDNPDEHEQITQRPTHARTLANIAEAKRREIPLRAGVIGVLESQRSDQASRTLLDLGVDEVRYDDLRGVGRGAVAEVEPDTSVLCGRCAHGNLAISPTGEVWPCVFTRWMPIGNVREQSLNDILNSDRMATVVGELRKEFTHRAVCVPNMCDPQCGPSCSPACQPKGDCTPAGNCAPNYR